MRVLKTLCRGAFDHKCSLFLFTTMFVSFLVAIYLEFPFYTPLFPHDSLLLSPFSSLLPTARDKNNFTSSPLNWSGWYTNQIDMRPINRRK